MTFGWFQAAVSVLSAITGGFVGGWTVAFRLGRWRQFVEDRLAAAERRLENGDPHVGKVPVLEAKLDTVIEELRAIKVEMRGDRKEFVSRIECERTHAAG